MGLIQTELTAEQKKIKTRAELNLHLKNGADELYYRAVQVWKLFWENPDGLSCQGVFDSFGSPDALTMAQLLGQTKALLDKIDPDLWQLARPGAVTPVIGEDGKPTGAVTVTLNA